MRDGRSGPRRRRLRSKNALMVVNVGSRNGSGLEEWVMGNLSGAAGVFPTAAASEVDDKCTFWPMPHLQLKFYLVTILGSVMGVGAIVGNAVLIFVFSTRPHFRQSCFLYMAGMASMDLLTAICYILVISTSIAYEYTANIVLMDLWYSTVIPLNAVSNIVMMASPYFLVVASLERYLVQFHRLSSVQRMPVRLVVMSVVVMLSVVSKGTVLFELEIADMTIYNCTGLASKYLQATALRQNEDYDSYWCFWYRNIVTVFLPFLALLFLNLRIILADYCDCNMLKCLACCNRRRKSSSAHPSSLIRTATIVRNRKESVSLMRSKQSLRDPRQRKSRRSKQRSYVPVLPDRAILWAQRAKTRVRKSNSRTLIVVVIEYLMCNSLSLFVTAWEHISMKTLVSDSYKEFYLIASDVISLLVVMACMIRLPTYLVCDVTFRKELQYMLCSRMKRPGQVAASASAYSNGDAPQRSDTQFTLLVMEVIRNKQRLANGTGGSGSVYETSLATSLAPITEYSPMLPAAAKQDESVVVFV